MEMKLQVANAMQMTGASPVTACESANRLTRMHEGRQGSIASSLISYVLFPFDLGLSWFGKAGAWHGNGQPAAMLSSRNTGAGVGYTPARFSRCDEVLVIAAARRTFRRAATRILADSFIFVIAGLCLLVLAGEPFPGQRIFFEDVR